MCGGGVEEKEEEKKNASFPEPQRGGIRLLSLCRMRAAGGVAIADERPVCPLSYSLCLSRRRPMHFDRIIGRSTTTSLLLCLSLSLSICLSLSLSALPMDMLNYFSRFVPHSLPLPWTIDRSRCAKTMMITGDRSFSTLSRLVRADL